MTAVHTPELDRAYLDFAETIPVYFALSGATDEVKIGFSSDVRARIRLLNNEGRFTGRTGVALLGWMRGGPRLEEEFHALFAEHRTKGEWFKSVPEMADVLAQRGFQGEPPIVKNPAFRVLTFGYRAARNRVAQVDVYAQPARSKARRAS
jgi:hypothetical protein